VEIFYYWLDEARIQTLQKVSEHGKGTKERGTLNIRELSKLCGKEQSVGVSIFLGRNITSDKKTAQ
jgi:hypothetical protein